MRHANRLSGILVKTLGPTRRRIILLVCAALSLFAIDAQAQNTVPQIMLTDEVVDRILANRETDPRTAMAFMALLDRAEEYLTQPTIAETYGTQGNKAPYAFQGFSQKPAERLTDLAMAWRLTGDPRFAERTRIELLQLAALETWHPEFFLGVGRISLAVALGYSWISETLNESEHIAIRNALIDKALTEGMKIYDLDQLYFDKGWVQPQQWRHPTPVPIALPDGTATADIIWPVASFNWNLICNSGMIVAALAVSETAPDLSNRIIEQAQISLRNGFAEFAPDGAWPEGPMYGALSARDAAVVMTALTSVLGHDFDLSRSDGLSQFGDFLMHATGPTGMLFNYGDSDTSTDLVPLEWFATHFQRPDYRSFLTDMAKSSHPAFALIWGQPDQPLSEDQRPKSFWFGNLGLVTMRSAWEDPEATYVGFKAGPLRSHHNNLDAGTFVLEAKGVRWAVDLGLGNYDLPGYFTDKRFDYYRTATIGQNTLTFGGGNQKTLGRAQIEDFGQFPGFHYAIADLSDPYGQAPGSVKRGIALIDGARVLIQDEIAGGQSDPVSWTMHTAAQVSVDGRTALLKQDGQELRARILSPRNAAFSLQSANPCNTPFNSDCRAQNPNTGITRLMIDLTAQDLTKAQTITVLFEPVEATKDQTLIPLQEWRLNATLSHGTTAQ